MAGDIGVDERLVLPGLMGMAPGPILHDYGPRVRIGLGGGTGESPDAGAPPPAPENLTIAERFGLKAFAMRQSPDYKQAKRGRNSAQTSWSGEGHAMPLHPPGDSPAERLLAPGPGDPNAGAPRPPNRLKGRVAVAIIMVSGPTPDLELDEDKQVKIVAEVQNGLGWLGAQSPARDVTFVYELRTPAIDLADDADGNSYETFEAPWRDAALTSLGLRPGLAGVDAYAADLRARLRADWSYCAFFTRYRVFHFAYASIGGARLTMHYDNDGWGPDNIDRVFAHETGHIFGAPDEYAAANCSCDGQWGPFKKPNLNCETCAPGGGESCIMRSNDWAMCQHTFFHLGFDMAVA